MTTTLEYIIIGHAMNDGQHDKEFELLAFTEGIPSQDIALYRKIVTLAPMPIADEKGSQSLAMVSYDTDTVILARSHFQQADTTLPVNQYILIPYETLVGIGGRIIPLQSLVRTPIPIYQQHHVVVPPLRMPTIATGNLNTRVEPVQRLLGDMLDMNFELAMTIVGAILHERHLLIRNFPMDLQQRVDFVQGVRLLLPTGAAMRMSFSTHSDAVTDAVPMLVFAEDVEDTGRWILDWQSLQPIPALLEHPYIQLLMSLWDGDVSEFTSEVKPMDILSLNFIEDDLLSDSLVKLTERFAVDQQVRHRESVETGAMIGALDSEISPQGRLRYLYIEKLLQNALNNRDTVAGKRVAGELNRDANLEEALSGRFDEMLESQPDTVYVFIRNRLNNFGVDERWLPRLKTAASSSLEIAIDEGDIATLASWLELIAREPQAYELDGVLRRGILEAQSRAHGDSELGVRLILIAARRVPDIMETLFEDEELMDGLPSHVGDALRHKDTDSLEALIDGEAEYFLLSVSHALQTSDHTFVSGRMVLKLWSLYMSEDKISLPAMYQAKALLRLMATQSSHLMTDDAIDKLLGQVIEANDSDLFVDMASHLANRGILFPRLSLVLKAHYQSLEQLMALMNWVSDIDNVSSSDIMKTYFDLLDELGWDVSLQPMIESVARLLNQNTGMTAPARHYSRLFDASTALKLASPSRVAMNRILEGLTDNEDVAFVVTESSRVHKQIAWSKPLLETFNLWWRRYTQAESLVHLQRLDRELDAQRNLESQRQILQTAIAMRKLLGNRDLLAFAEAINTAYSILEGISDAFDKSQLTDVDPATVRNELDSISGELPLDERHILSKNLRELAQQIIQMSDKRSKPSIMRGDEAIERQLMYGEASPQGSIDVMKWIAGYLGGSHNTDEDE